MGPKFCKIDNTVKGCCSIFKASAYPELTSDFLPMWTFYTLKFELQYDHLSNLSCLNFFIKVVFIIQIMIQKLKNLTKIWSLSLKNMQVASEVGRTLLIPWVNTILLDLSLAFVVFFFFFFFCFYMCLYNYITSSNPKPGPFYSSFHIIGRRSRECETFSMTSSYDCIEIMALRMTIEYVSLCKI